MGIVFRIKSLERLFYDNSSAAWNGLKDYCPSLEEIFPEEFVKNEKGYSEKKYFINPSDKKLDIIINELENYLNRSVYEMPIYDLAKGMKSIIDESRENKKQLEVGILWR